MEDHDLVKVKAYRDKEGYRRQQRIGWSAVPRSRRPICSVESVFRSLMGDRFVVEWYQMCLFSTVKSAQDGLER